MHAAEPGRPRGLADYLALMFDHLVSHQRREEQVLFPLILSGGSPLVRFPIARMMAEHVDVEEQLVRLRTLTHDYTCPPSAPAKAGGLGGGCAGNSIPTFKSICLENEELLSPS